MTNNSSKDRGVFLTILVIYGALQAILVFFSGIIYPIVGMGLRGGSQILLVSLLEFIPLVAALYGIWMWKKWGVYLLFASILITIISTFVFDLVLKVYSGYAQGVIFLDILGAALWFWAIYRKWSLFE